MLLLGVYWEKRTCKNVPVNGPILAHAEAPVHIVARLHRSSWMSLDNLWGISLHWERTSECILLYDVEDVKFVINYDYPNSSEDYIHRIGRTARSQKTGTAYTFFTPNNMKQASDLISVLREANQAINPKLIQMAEDRGGRGRGGRGGYKDDRRDRYSGGGRSNFGGSSYRDRDSDRGFGNGPKSAYGGSKAQNGGSYGGNSGNSSGNYGNNSYSSSNGQGNFGAPANQVGGFGNQNFQGPPQFGGMQRPNQNGMNHPPFPFNSQPPPPQAQQPPPPPPMVPYPMPPPFPQ